MRFISLSTPLALLLACGEKAPATQNDTGSVTEEEEITYESGCFVVDGGDGYKYLNDAIAVADEGSQISPVGCTSFEHEEKVIIDKAVRLVGVGQDRFTLVAPVNETAITIVADGVEISDLSVQSTRSGISVEGANDVYLHDMTISEVGNFAIKSTGSELELENLTLWNNQDGAVSVDGGSITATGLDVRGNVGNSILIGGGALFNLSDSEVVEAQPTDPASISDGFGVYIDGGSTFISSNNLYDGNTLMGVQSVDGTIDMSNDVVSGSLSTGVWAEGPGSMTLNDVTLDGNLTYGIINMATGELSLSNVTISVDPLMSPSYDIETWEDSGFGSMGLFSNSPKVTLDGVEITGYNNCGANLQSDGTGEITVEGFNIHDVGRKGLVIAGHNGTMNNVVLKNIFDLDGNSSKEPDEDGNVADYETFCQQVDRNAAAAIITSDLTVSNVLTTDIEGFGWSIIQANVDMDTAYAANNTCSSFLAFQGGLQARNIEVANNNFEYDGLGSGVVGYSATLLSVENSTFNGDTEEVLDISAFLYDSTGIFTNNTFTGGGIGVYSNESSIESSNNSYSNHVGYSAFMSGESANGSTHQFVNDVFMTSEGSTASGTPIYCSDAGTVEVDTSTFSDVSATYALYFGGCDSEIENTTFSNIASYSIYGYEGNHDISTSTFTNVNTVGTSGSALYFFGSQAMNVSVSDVSIENSGGDGIYTFGLGGETNPMLVDLNGIELQNISDDALFVYGGQAYVEDVTVNGASQGLYAESATVDMVLSTIENATESGVNFLNSTMNIDTVTITTTGEHGIEASGGTLTGSNIQVSDATESGLFGDNGLDLTLTTSSFTNGLYGIQLEGTETLPVAFAISDTTMTLNGMSGASLTYANGTFDSSTANNNQEMGMECTEATFTSCSGNDLTSNLLGEQTGCDTACGTEANPTAAE